MPPLAQIVALLVQLEPDIQELVLELITVIKANHDGNVTAAQAAADATKRLGLLLARLENIRAQAQGVNAAVDADATAKFKP